MDLNNPVTRGNVNFNIDNSYQEVRENTSNDKIDKIDFLFEEFNKMKQKMEDQGRTIEDQGRTIEDQGKTIKSINKDNIELKQRVHKIEKNLPQAMYSGALKGAALVTGLYFAEVFFCDQTASRSDPWALQRLKEQLVEHLSRELSISKTNFIMFR
jgi:hypothetical protein